MLTKEFTFVPVYGNKPSDVLLVSENTSWGQIFVDAFHDRENPEIVKAVNAGKPFKVKMTLEILDE